MEDPTCEASWAFRWRQETWEVSEQDRQVEVWRMDESGELWEEKPCLEDLREVPQTQDGRCPDSASSPSKTEQASGFRSTVDSWNRQRDQRRIEEKLGLAEEGNSTTIFVSESEPQTVIAIGYQRVLYGDHGPYVEFTFDQVCWEAFTDVVPNKPTHAYYDERKTADGHVKAYEQRRTVRNRPNPPPGEWSVNNNRYDTGYADYQPGFIYISADSLGISGVPSVPRPAMPRPSAKSRSKRKSRPTQKARAEEPERKSRISPRPRQAEEVSTTSKWSSETEELLNRLNAFNPVKAPNRQQASKRKRPSRPSGEAGSSNGGYWMWVED